MPYITSSIGSGSDGLAEMALANRTLLCVRFFSDVGNAGVTGVAKWKCKHYRLACASHKSKFSASSSASLRGFEPTAYHLGVALNLCNQLPPEFNKSLSLLTFNAF